MIKRLALSFLVVLLMGVVSACSYTPIEGTIEDKSTYYQWISTGKGGYFQKRYRFTVETVSGESTRVTVSKDFYNDCREGDAYSRNVEGDQYCTHN